MILKESPQIYKSKIHQPVEFLILSLLKQLLLNPKAFKVDPSKKLANGTKLHYLPLIPLIEKNWRTIWPRKMEKSQYIKNMLTAVGPVECLFSEKILFCGKCSK